MIKTVPHGTISPQMCCINGIKGWFTRTQICGLFANYFSLKPLSLSLKSHMNVLCALKLTD